jgi:hypothetical protein
MPCIKEIPWIIIITIIIKIIQGIKTARHVILE